MSIFKQFFVTSLLGVICSFLVHLTMLWLLNLPLFNHLIIRAYVINYVEAILIFTFLYLGRKKFKTSLGFIFMGNSFFKFILFFVFFYPTYFSDNTIEKVEFLTFFIPYSICLIFETYFLSKISNNN